MSHMEHGASRTAGFPMHQCLTHSFATGVGATSIPWGADHWLGTDCVDIGRTPESLPPSGRVCLKF